MATPIDIQNEIYGSVEHSPLNTNGHLPQEVLQHVFSYLYGNQKAFHACSLTSRSWYSASIAYLYESPIINGRNFDRFVEAICPSVNAHVRRNGLANLVRRLDMSSLVHSGSKSLTARLLGRVKTGLEEFVAPQASFAYVPHLVGGRNIIACNARYLFALLTFLQSKLPRSSLEMLKASALRPLLRFRIHINRGSLTLDELASEARKPTSAYVPCGSYTLFQFAR